jgi:alkanesulfonate monooxygenase SsuD/methylene tetrahydromethanopterin reductase-like flavin-dependent oxidoreductase (luciferase family)
LPVGPEPAAGNRVRVMIGGSGDAAMRRTVRYGQGWTAGGVSPEVMEPMVVKLRRAWQEAGREGEPRIAALVYFGLSEPDTSRAALRHYYGFLGQEWADQVAESAIRSPHATSSAPSPTSASPNSSSIRVSPRSTRWTGSPTPYCEMPQFVASIAFRPIDA